MIHATYSKLEKKTHWFDLFYLLLCVITVYVVIWSFTGMWPWTRNIYNSYTLQANAWLHGRLDLGQNYSYLELACLNGKYYVSFPPFPSVILFPFTLLFGLNTPDNMIASVSILVGTIYTYKLVKEMGKSNQSSFFWTLFLIVGSNILFITMNGWVWFFAQNLCFTLSMMAIYYAMKGKGGTSLFLWAASVGCRPFQVIYLPVLLILLYQFLKNQNLNETLMMRIKSHLYWAIAPLIVAFCYMALNYFRFGNILEFGHNYLPEFLKSEKGQFDISYVIANMKNLCRLPEVSDNGILGFPKFNGMSIWIVSPIFISYLVYLIAAFYKRRIKIKSVNLVIICLVLLHILLLTAHKTMGGWQFGNRYTCDTLPYLFYGMILLIPKDDRIEKYNYPLFFLGLSLNLVGTIAVINNWI